MRTTNSPRFLFALTGILLILVVMAATGCNSGAPTRPAPTPVPPTAIPTLTPVPLVQPTAAVLPTLPSLPPAGTSPTPLGATLVPTATAISPTVRATAKPAAQPAQPTAPKAATLGGKIAYGVATDAAPRLHGIWVAKGDGTGATHVLDYAMWPAFSPTGKQLAFFQLPGGGKNEGLYVSDAFGGNPVPAFISPGVCCTGWSHDGSWIAFADSPRPKKPTGAIKMVKADGFYKTVVDLKVTGTGPAFSPDGKSIAFAGCLPNTSTCGIFAAPTDGSGSIRTISKDYGGNPKWSPNGAKIVYQANDNEGHLQVFVVNADGSGKKQLTSGKSNDGQPAWSVDGNSIYWRSDQNGTAWGIFVMSADGSNPRRLIDNVPPDPNLWGWESLSVAP